MIHFFVWLFETTVRQLCFESLDVRHHLTWEDVWPLWWYHFAEWSIDWLIYWLNNRYLLYKHHWNTNRSFARKHVFTREDNILSGTVLLLTSEELSKSVFKTRSKMLKIAKIKGIFLILPLGRTMSRNQ